MQNIIQKCINELKSNNGIILSYADADFMLCDVNNDTLIGNTDALFKAILVRQDIYIEDYCGGVIPIVYDLIEFSNKALFLELPKLKNASEHLITNEKFSMYHVPKDRFLLQLCNKYKKGIAILELKKEVVNSFYRVNLSMHEHPFKSRSIICLKENGEVKVIEK